MCVVAAVDKRKSTPLGPVAASHSPVVVHVIQDGGKELRCARLTGDVCDVTVCSGDTWRQLAEVQRLDVEDASDELIAFLTRHASHLACLESLSVTWTPMKMVPSSWTRSLLPRLISLSLTRNQLRSVDCFEASCSQLEKLNLSNNLIVALPRHFGRSMPHLTSLVLTGNGLTALPESVGRMSQLRSLECSGNKLAKLPASIAELSELAVLDVSSNNLTALPYNIGHLSKLEDLRASGNKLTAVQRQNSNTDTSITSYCTKRTTMWPLLISKFETVRKRIKTMKRTLYTCIQRLQNKIKWAKTKGVPLLWDPAVQLQ